MSFSDSVSTQDTALLHPSWHCSVSQCAKPPRPCVCTQSPALRMVLHCIASSTCKVGTCHFRILYPHRILHYCTHPGTAVSHSVPNHLGLVYALSLPHSAWSCTALLLPRVKSAHVIFGFCIHTGYCTTAPILALQCLTVCQTT